MNCRPVLMALAGLALGCAASCRGVAAMDVDSCVAGLIRALPVQVASTIERIEGPERQLLALRSYLRSTESLTSRWSWSEEQIAAYAQSAEYRATQTELGRINARFEATNPGYTLYVNSQVRSVEKQIRLWNGNSSVLSTARSLQQAMRAQLSKLACEATDDPAQQTLGDFLRTWQPSRPAPLAAPGLSKHGQGRAFDFQVKRGDRIVAGTDTSATKMWDREGWTAKLRSAVNTGSDKFIGPLPAPYEPWHYEYRP